MGDMSLAGTDNETIVKNMPVGVIDTAENGVKGQPENVVTLSCTTCNTKLNTTSSPHLSHAGQQPIARTEPSDGASMISDQDADEPDPAKSLIITIAVLLAFVILGDVVTQAATLPIPGAVVGLGAFFFYLVYCGSVPENIAVIVPLLLRHLSLLFIPVGVGAMTFLTQLSTEWIGLALTITGTTTLTLVVTATVFTLVSRLIKREAPDGDNYEQ